MSKNSDDYLIFTAGALLGVLGGVLAGIMFSPKSGVEMRQELKNYAKDLFKEVPSDADMIKDSMNKNINRLKCSVENQLNKIQDAVKASKLASAKLKEEMNEGY
ncbi:MAG: YtxH domain-containing protein [Candidatus Gastranaerophilales bacterium]|jgi:gas vesicle protein|nr:YtxH domain-containing protein [Candidatus Gastranaerophilales bacterium]